MYNWMLEKVVFQLGDLFLGTGFVRDLRYWRKMDRADEETIRHTQIRNLKNLLLFISRENDYYRQYLSSAKKIAASDPVTVLKSLPLLGKTEIRHNVDKLVSTPFTRNRHRMITESSSGSSGVQGKVLMTRKEALAANAIQTHLWEWSGYRLGKELLQLGMTLDRKGIKRLKDILTRTTYMPAFQIDENEVKTALKQFQNKTGAFFGGYASGLYSYACLAEALATKNHFKAVISWGDKMFPHYRRKIEAVFQTKVFDVYGCTEGLIMAGQCEYGSYHVLTPHVFLELLDDRGNEVKPGEIGNVVATRLDGRSFPLVRYQLGDLAIASKNDGPCRCGRQYPRLSMIIGRDTDIVYSPAGKALIVHFFTAIFEHELDIKQYRVIQHPDKSILIEYITEIKDPSAIIERLTQKLNAHCGEELPITFVKVDAIPPTKSGKPQIIASYLKKSEQVSMA